MRRRLVAPLAVLILTATMARAQQGSVDGSIITLDGVDLDTGSPEFWMAGGDLGMIRRVQEYRLLQQQRAYFQQIEQMQRADEKRLAAEFRQNPEARKRFEAHRKKLREELARLDRQILGLSSRSRKAATPSSAARPAQPIGVAKPLAPAPPPPEDPIFKLIEDAKKAKPGGPSGNSSSTPQPD